MKKSMMRFTRLIRDFAPVALAFVICSGCASRMLYYPTHQEYTTPAASGYPYEEVTFPSRDGTSLTGWFIPAVGPARGTVLHFHGNAQNMTAHYTYTAWLPKEGFNLFLFDYRGYGKSDGAPNRKGVLQDSCAALEYLRSRPDIDGNRIVILGQSLGGAAALSALDETGTQGVRAVAIDSAFYSYRLIVRDKMKQIPVVGLFRWPLSFVIISNARSPGSTIRTVSPVPILIFHGTSDRVVPYRHGQLLYEAAKPPKEFISIPNGHHTDALVRDDPVYRKVLLDFFDDALATDNTRTHKKETPCL